MTAYMEGKLRATNSPSISPRSLVCSSPTTRRCAISHSANLRRSRGERGACLSGLFSLSIVHFRVPEQLEAECYFPGMFSRSTPPPYCESALTSFRWEEHTSELQS